MGERLPCAGLRMLCAAPLALTSEADLPGLKECIERGIRTGV